MKIKHTGNTGFKLAIGSLFIELIRKDQWQQSLN